MTKINSAFSLGYACIAILCLSACAGDTAQKKPVNLTRPGSTLPDGSVVLLDPTSDDSMLPALGEGLSHGAVTIYNLDGPQAPLPIRSAAAPVQTANAVYAGNGGMDTPTSNIQLHEPSGMGDSDSNDDNARVTIFGLDTGAPVEKRPVPVLAPAPTLPPPVDMREPLTASPFTTNKEGAVVLDNKPATVKKSQKTKPSTKAGAPTPITLPPVTNTTTLGAGSRAVTATDLMGTGMSAMPPSSAPMPVDQDTVQRPPKGMTY